MKVRCILSLVTLLVMLFVTRPASADDEIVEAIPGEYVVSVPSLLPLREKALTALESVAAPDLEILDASKHVMLVGEAGDGRKLPEEAVPETALEGLPEELRKRKREIRRAGASSMAEARVLTLEISKNFVFRASATPNDPNFASIWGLNQSNDVDIDAPEAWDRSTGARSVIVGVIDTGVDYNHPDLSANVWTNPGEIPGNNIDDDNNGYIDDVHGFNAITYTSFNRRAGDPYDDNGHGTHVAGTIGATGNNGVGVVGVNWRVTIVPIKFLSSSGSGSLMDAIEAVDYATALKRKGINIILTNNSWGGGGYSQQLVDAIARNRDEGILFVAAAGNSSQNLDSSPSYPANYNLANIVSVAAMDSNGAPASFSNFGATTVDIAAPGVQVSSTYPGNRYVYLSGTSMATPFVSGALALLKSYSSNLDWQSMIQILYASADVRGSLQNKCIGNRALNVDRMLQAAPFNPAPPELVVPTPTPSVPTPTPTATATPTATPTVPPGNFDLVGRVLSGGAPVPGARVNLVAGGVTQSRLSTSDGQFRFDDVPGPVSYTLTTTKPGLTFAPLSAVLVRDTSVSLTATARTFTLTAKIESSNRLPLSGVSVDAGPYGRVTTDGQGAATFTMLHGALYSLLPSSTQYHFPQGSVPGELLGDTTRLLIGRPVETSP
jgi:subtilisin family serine protease